MRFIWASLFITIGLGLIATPASAQGAKTDKEIVQILIKQSIAQYSGVCPCPYSINRGGRKCGSRSAYSKPGGAEPLCYARDVTPAMITRYRNR
ncbi:MAG: hypothetical protein L3J65_06945 [Robiginitomaculum sp.]|nr:hypothetical protein [Robiginitomaculum sp.]